MTTLLLVGLEDADRTMVSGIPVDVRPCSAAELPDQLDDAVDVVAVSCADPAGALTTIQAIHRRRPELQVVALVSEDTEAELRRHVRFAPDVPAGLELVHSDGSDTVDRLAEICRGAALRRSHHQVMEDIGARASRHRVPLVGATLGSLLEHAPLGVVVADVEHRVLACNRAAADLLHVPQQVAGAHLHEIFIDASLVPRLVSAATTIDAADPWPEETTHGPAGTRLDVSAAMTRLEDGRSVVMLLVGDATARTQAEQERDLLSDQVAMMGRVSEALVGAEDPEEALRLIAEQVVPTLADCVTMQLYDDRGAARQVAVKHTDARLARLSALVRENLGTAGSDAGPSRRLARGEPPILLTEVAEEVLRRFVPDPELLPRLLDSGVDSVIAVPLAGRRTRVGSMMLVNGSGSGKLTQQALAIAVEVGRRVGIALETLHLYSQQRAIAEELQRSMLTAPPSTEHAEIAVRYLPASQEAQVGGDWYDAYLQTDGSIVMSIGDVVGHDYRAAAAMGQLRGMLRGIGYPRGVGPAAMMRSLDEAIEGLLPGTTATAVAAHVSAPKSESIGEPLKVCWSNAGHPPPVLLGSSGAVRVLTDDDADVILGVAPELSRHESATQMHSGDTLVLYSDGLIERRDRDIDRGVEALTDALTEGAGRSLHILCEHLLARLVPREHDDDVALVALRLR